MDLQAPSVLAQLPRPLHASTGKTHISEVYSLAESKKRKRYEVVVAVDGEAVNIYNVQTPKLVTSYAVPPQSAFSCRPCSVRRKLSNKSSVKRQTYGAVQHPEQQIKCFVEESGGNGASAPTISSSAFSVKDSSSPTVFIGVVPTESRTDGEDSFDILTVHKDGRVRRLSPDLKTQKWNIQHSEMAKVSSSHEVHTCFLVEFEDVKKSLFKRRQDLAALALGNSASDAEPSVLLLVSHPIGTGQVLLKDVKVQIFAVPTAAHSTGLNLDESLRLRHLLTVNVPELNGEESFDSSSLQWSFHSGSAGLNLSFERGFINFDLSQYSPTATSQFVLADERFSSLMRISPQSVIGAGKSIVALYDTQYQSIQRSIAVEDLVSGGSSGAAHRTPITFVSYFAKLGIAVATRGNTLLAFDLSALHTSSAQSLKRPRDGLLIDAIGRGIGSSAAQWDAVSKKHRSEQMAILGLTSSEQVEKWNKLTTDLAKLTTSQDAEAFDVAVKSYFGSSEEPQSLPAPGHHINPEVTLFLLSKIFSLKDDYNNDNVSATSAFKLSVAVWPKATCSWLIEAGSFSMNNVEIALRRSLKPRILPPFPSGSFVQALIDDDPSLRKLNQVLQGPVIMDADEVAYALKIVLNMARSRYATLEESVAAITDESQNNNIDDASTSKKEVSSSTEASLADIFTGLNVALRKIHTHSLPAIVKSLRSTLSRTEIISMIHHLRICLATGGHTSRFTENPPTPISPDQITPSLSLDTISELLTASLDAIGPSGWISAAAGIDGAGSREIDLIGDMKSEISAALAGVEEATYLKGILREYLRYADNVMSSSKTAAVEQPSAESAAAAAEVPPATTTSHVKYEKINGADLVVFAAPEGDDGYEGDASANKMLPLSLKPASSTDVGRTKVKKSTGEVKARSSREIGYLRRKAAGKYSFERLIV